MNTLTAYQMANATGSFPSNGTVFMIDDAAFAHVNLNPGTITGAPIPANNRSVGPVSYTFYSTNAQYQKIFSAQCNRVGAFIYDQLDRLERGENDHNEQVIEQIASVINLVGEPAYMTAKLEAQVLEDDRFRLGKLLLAIAASTHKETENERIALLRHYLSFADYKTKSAAIRALGRMKTGGAKKVLREIRDHAGKDEIGYLASALLR